MCHLQILLDLEAKFKQYPKETPKIIVFESVCSMCGSIGPIKETRDLAEQYGALIFLDEVRHIENDGEVFILNNDASRCWPVLFPRCQCHWTSGSWCSSCCWSNSIPNSVMNRVDIITGMMIVAVSSWMTISIAQVISSVTVSPHFDGSLNVDLNELQTNLVPYPSVILSDYTRNLTYCSDSPASTSLFPRMPPLLSTEKAGREQNPVLDMTLSCFENGDQMVKCNPKVGKYSTADFHWFLLISWTIWQWLAVSSSVGTLSQGCSSLLTGIRIGICNEPPAYAPGGDPAKALRALCTLFK